MSLGAALIISAITYAIGVATGKWHTTRKLRRHEAGMATLTSGRLSSGPD